MEKNTFCFLNVINCVYAKTIPEINAFLRSKPMPFSLQFKRNFLWMETNILYDYTFLFLRKVFEKWNNCK